MVVLVDSVHVHGARRVIVLLLEGGSIAGGANRCPILAQVQFHGSFRHVQPRWWCIQQLELLHREHLNIP